MHISSLKYPVCFSNDNLIIKRDGELIVGDIITGDFVVGVFDGDHVGYFVGFLVGDFVVGGNVGFLVGDFVVGFIVGDIVVGDNVVGFLVGDFVVGFIVGFLVGDLTVGLVGDFVCIICVWSQNTFGIVGVIVVCAKILYPIL